MDKVDISKLVKLKFPEKGEENTIFSITNYNDVTERCYIVPVNMNLLTPNEELVSIHDLVNVETN